MLGSAADAEDVLQETWLRWARRSDQAEVRDAARLPGPDHHPAVAQPDPHAVPAPRVVRRPVAARAAAHLARRGRGRRARRQRLDRDAAGARDARRRPSGRCSCCARSSTCRYDEIAAAVDKTPGRGPPDRAPRPQPRRGAPAAPAGDHAPSRTAVIERFLGRGRHRGPAGAARRAGARRRADHRRRRAEAGRAASDPRASRRCCGSWPRSCPTTGPPRPTPAVVNGGPGAAAAARRRARHRRHHAGRRRPGHRALPRPQPAQARPAWTRRSR